MVIMWLSLLHYYTRCSGFLAYFFILFKKIKLSSADFLLLFGLVLLICLQLNIKDSLAILKDIRFYWGWIIFYFIFKSNPVDQKTVNSTLVVLCIMAIIEAVLINTVVSARMLPNFPSDSELAYTHFSMGGYQRPYSFGGNATVASSLLVTLMALCEVQGWRLALSTMTVLFFVSGTGTLTLLLLLVVRYWRWVLKIALPVSFVAALCFFVLSDRGQLLFGMFASKVGLEYVDLIVNFKLFQIIDAFQNVNAYTLLCGDPEGFRGGDFGALAFVLSNGFFGTFLFLSLILSRLSKTNMFPLLLVVIASFHYPVMFFMPGQMLFGMLLSINNGGSFLKKLDQCDHAK